MTFVFFRPLPFQQFATQLLFLPFSSSRFCLTVTFPVLQFFLYGVPSIYYGDEEGLEGDLDPYNRRCFDWVNGDKELTEHYKKLAKIRKSNSAFKCGSTNILKAEKGLFIFTRGESQEQITIALNRTDHAKECIFSGRMQELYSNKKGKKFELPANGFLVLKAI